jgi:hypothetical protein
MSTHDPNNHPIDCDPFDITKHFCRHGLDRSWGCPDCDSEASQPVNSPQPRLPFDLVREWRKRAETGNKFLDETLYPKAAYNRGLVNTLLRCADELEANPTWKEAMKANS